MAIRVGVSGGVTLIEFGSQAEMQRLFETLSAIDASKAIDRDGLILDRLYRRYLKREELERASEILIAFEKALDLDARPSAAIQKFFEDFTKCKVSAEICLRDLNVYRPLRIVKSDTPDFVVEKKRSLDEYDALDGPPFWTR